MACNEAQPRAQETSCESSLGMPQSSSKCSRVQPKDLKSNLCRQVSAKLSGEVPTDLEGVIAAWEDLPPAVKAGIVAMVEASVTED